jgi:hypothetical protein
MENNVDRHVPLGRKRTGSHYRQRGYQSAHDYVQPAGQFQSGYKLPLPSALSSR